MTLSYGLRLFSVCLAFVFMTYVTVGLAVSFLTPAAVRIAGRTRAGVAARFLLALRLLPAGLGLAGVAALCVPAYILFEPKAEVEEVGVACLVAALLGFAMCVVSLLRAIKSVVLSALQRRGCALRASRELVCVVEAPAPLCALTGILRPRLLISRGVLQALPAEELAAALAHERAHLNSGDNLKRLLLAMAPRHRGAAALEREWARFAEFAADDQAVAGDDRRSLSLASALVRVARLGSGPRMALVSPLIDYGQGLAERVERLLAAAVPAGENRAWPQARFIAAAGAATAAVVLLFQPASLQGVYEMLEWMMH